MGGGDGGVIVGNGVKDLLNNPVIHGQLPKGLQELQITLQRTLENEVCTQGILTADSLTLYTLELPWAPEEGYPGGMPDKSCVPAGVYELVLHDTPAHPKAFALVNSDLGVIHEPDPMFPNARTA